MDFNRSVYTHLKKEKKKLFQDNLFDIQTEKKPTKNKNRSLLLTNSKLEEKKQNNTKQNKIQKKKKNCVGERISFTYFYLFIYFSVHLL